MATLARQPRRCRARGAEPFSRRQDQGNRRRHAGHVRRARSRDRLRLRDPRQSQTPSGSKSAPGFTPERSNYAARTSAESQSISVLASPRSAARPKYSCLGPSQTSSRAPASSSRIADNMNSRACPEPGSYMPSCEPAVETARRSRDLSGEHRHHATTAWPDSHDDFHERRGICAARLWPTRASALGRRPALSGSPRLSSPRATLQQRLGDAPDCCRASREEHDLLWLRAEFTRLRRRALGGCAEEKHKCGRARGRAGRRPRVGDGGWYAWMILGAAGRLRAGRSSRADAYRPACSPRGAPGPGGSSISPRAACLPQRSQRRSGPMLPPQPAWRVSRGGPPGVG